MSGSTPLSHTEMYNDNLMIILKAEAGRLTRILRKIFLFLSVSSLYIGGSGFCKALAGFILLGAAANLHACFSVFLTVFSVYSLNKLTDIKEDAINFPERSGFLAGRTRLILVYSLGAYALAVLLVALEKPTAIPVIFIPLIANALYSSRLIPGLPRLKDIPFMKNLIVAISWALVCVLIPAAYSERLDAKVLLIICFMALKSIINTVLYDVRDVAGDKENGIITVPILLGLEKTSLILLTVNSSLLPLAISTKGIAGQLMVGMIIYGYIYILYFSEKMNPFSLDLFVDGEWMLACISIMMISRMGLS
jgi:4-hydroxybenzoate polyprenyltransferase